MNEQIKNQEIDTEKKVEMRDIDWSLGFVSFIMSIVSLVLVAIYWHDILIFNKYKNNFSLELFIFSVCATPIISIGIIVNTLRYTIWLKPKDLKIKDIKDKYYMLAGFIIAVIVFALYAPFIIYLLLNWV